MVISFAYRLSPDPWLFISITCAKTCFPCFRSSRDVNRRLYGLNSKEDRNTPPRELVEQTTERINWFICERLKIKSFSLFFPSSLEQVAFKGEKIYSNAQNKSGSRADLVLRSFERTWPWGDNGTITPKGICMFGLNWLDWLRWREPCVKVCNRAYDESKKWTWLFIGLLFAKWLFSHQTGRQFRCKRLERNFKFAVNRTTGGSLVFA